MIAQRPMRWDAVIVAALAAVTVAAIGGTLTDLGPWYQSLKEPSWKPPDVAFGPIWTVIFAAAATAGVLAWRRERTPAGRQWILGLFACNGFLNILWTLMFFRVQRPDLALVEVGGLWLSILALIIVLRRCSGLAAAFMLPYLLWVSIAMLLNFDVVALNGPFG